MAFLGIQCYCRISHHGSEKKYSLKAINRLMRDTVRYMLTGDSSYGNQDYQKISQILKIAFF
jgi:hypothetical protein